MLHIEFSRPQLNGKFVRQTGIMVRPTRLAYMLVITVMVSVTFMGRSEGQVTPPTEWELQQNDPEPFCMSRHGFTRITVLAPQAAHLSLLLRPLNASQVVATLLDTAVPAAGRHTLIWDGIGDDGSVVPEGEYRYTLVAQDLSQTETYFEDSKLATVFCTAPVTPRSWAVVKNLFK